MVRNSPGCVAPAYRSGPGEDACLRYSCRPAARRRHHRHSATGSVLAGRGYEKLRPTVANRFAGPGSAPHRPAKRWPTSAYGALARILVDRGITPVVIGTAEERPLAEAIRRRLSQDPRPDGPDLALRDCRAGAQGRLRDRQRHRPDASDRDGGLPRHLAVLRRVEPGQVRPRAKGHGPASSRPGRSGFGVGVESISDGWRPATAENITCPRERSFLIYRYIPRWNAGKSAGSQVRR